jgi:hypothetical protein
MSKTTGKNGTTAEVTQVIAGAKKRIPNVNEALPVGTSTMTVAAVLGQLQTIVDNRAAVVAAQATAKAKVAAERAALPALTVILHAFVAFIRFTFGSDPEALADFGLAPHKVPEPLTAEQKAVAAAKRRATREARGTTSAKQKKSVKGNVTATLVVTPVAAPTPAPAPAPAAPVAPAAPPATTQPKA